MTAEDSDREARESMKGVLWALLFVAVFWGLAGLILWPVFS